MFSDSEILRIARYLNIDFSKFSFEDFKRGINIEMEHGLKNLDTNVTNNDLLKIALAHLKEYPNYYNKDYGLLAFEEFLKSKSK